MQDKQNTNNNVLNEIAKQILGVETLKTQNSDDLDFYNLPVWMIKAALEEAFKAGQAAIK